MVSTLVLEMLTMLCNVMVSPLPCFCCSLARLKSCLVFFFFFWLRAVFVFFMVLLEISFVLLDYGLWGVVVAFDEMSTIFCCILMPRLFRFQKKKKKHYVKPCVLCHVCAVGARKQISF